MYEAIYLEILICVLVKLVKDFLCICTFSKILSTSFDLILDSLTLITLITLIRINKYGMLFADMLEKMLCYDVRLTKLLNKEGWTALSYAASMQYIDKVQILNRYDPSSAFISNNDKTFPIHVAVLGGHPTIVDSLTNSRFLLNAKGQNIFHLAALFGECNIVSYLMRNLSDIEFLINQKDEDGNTPLHLATQYQHIEVVEILIQNEKVNVGLFNKQGLTAYDLANNINCQKLKVILERAKIFFF